MCSKKISLPKSGKTDIVQNNVGHSMLQSDWNIDIIQNSVGRSMLRGDGGGYGRGGALGGGNLVSTWIRSVDIHGIGFGGFFFIP